MLKMNNRLAVVDVAGVTTASAAGHKLSSSG